MSKKSPKELDDLFRLGAEQHDFSYDAEAWEQMEHLLDKDDRRRFFWWWWLGGIGTVALIGIGWFFLFQNGDLSQMDTPGDSPRPNSTAQTPPSPNRQGQTIPYPTPNIAHTPPATGAERANNKNEKQSSEKSKGFPKGKNKPRNTKDKETKATMPPPMAEAIPTGTDREEDSTTSQVHAPAPLSGTKDGINEKPAFAKNGLLRLPVLPLTLFEVKSSPIIAANLLNIPNIKTGDIPPKKRDDQPKARNNFLLFGLVAASERTSVGMGDFSQSSWKLGGEVAYHFRGKYSAGIGPNYIRKKYEAGTGEYIPPKGFWTRGIAPTSSDGICNILEIPLTASYFLKGYDNKGFYASAGLSSYFLLWEWYGYNYDQPDPDLIRDWQTAKNSQYWFAIGQISVGYNKTSGGNTSLLFEPYLQFPLSGVGHGQVKLWSIGISMKANFKVTRLP